MTEKITIAEALREHGFVIHHIKGVSMMPMLRQGLDAVRLVPYTGELRVDDIPLYVRESDGAYVLHRAIKICDGYCITLGDNCIRRETIKNESIIAVADGFFREDKFVPKDDPEYLKYVKRHKRKYPLRLAKYVLGMPVRALRRVLRVLLKKNKNGK